MSIKLIQKEIFEKRNYYYFDECKELFDSINAKIEKGEYKKFDSTSRIEITLKEEFVPRELLTSYYLDHGIIISIREVKQEGIPILEQREYKITFYDMATLIDLRDVEELLFRHVYFDELY